MFPATRIFEWRPTELTYSASQDPASGGLISTIKRISARPNALRLSESQFTFMINTLRLFAPFLESIRSLKDL
jgi:hypothetical protein